MARKAKDGTVLLDDVSVKAQKWRAEKEARKAVQQEALEAEQQRNTGKKCPLKARNLNDVCLRDCALFEAEGGCVLGGSEPRETEGMYCPIVGKRCADSCALYSEAGCTIRPVRS